MHGNWLTEARQRKGWTQEQTAARLGVSQPYLSLLERNRRQLTKPLVKRLQAHQFAVPATELPKEDASPSRVDQQQLAEVLGTLGYPGFSHMKKGQQLNPAQVLFVALLAPNLEPRLTEALPWVAWHYADLDWPWLLERVKVHDVQNRLGFVVTLALHVAKRHRDQVAAPTLAAVEQQLEHSRLVREDTLARESMTQAERRWLRERRPPSAKHWNLLTDLRLEHLSYGA